MFGDGVPYLDAPIRQQAPATLDKEFDQGSKITLQNPNRQQIDDLAKLGKVWGLLKYYHPAVADGQFNWDYELFRIVPKYLAAQTEPEKAKVLNDWINKLGPFKIGLHNEITQGELKIKPDFSWIAKSFTDAKLIQK